MKEKNGIRNEGSSYVRLGIVLGDVRSRGERGEAF